MVSNIFVDSKVIKVIRKAHSENNKRYMWTRKNGSKWMMQGMIV
jgi:hypothetical protein